MKTLPLKVYYEYPYPQPMLFLQLTTPSDISFKRVPKILKLLARIN
jgi:hypothetical protein